MIRSHLAMRNQSSDQRAAWALPLPALSYSVSDAFSMGGRQPNAAHAILVQTARLEHRENDTQPSDDAKSRLGYWQMLSRKEQRGRWRCRR